MATRVVRSTSSLYTRIVVTVFLTVAASSIISFAGFYFPARSTILNQQEETARRNLVQISYFERLVAELARAGAAQVFSDPAMARLLFFEQVDVHELSTGLSRLDLFRWNNSHIHSIYLYNSRNGTVYVSADEADHAVQNLSDLFDEDLTRLFRSSSPQDLDLALFPRTIELNRSNRSHVPVSVPVLTLIYFGNTSVAPAEDFSAVIVNVTEEWIKGTLDALNSDENYRIHILVPTIDGTYSTFVPQDSSEELDEETRRLVIESTDPDARFILSHGANREIVTVYNPRFSQWRFFSRSDYETVMSPLYRFGEIAALVAGSSLLLAIIVSLLGSRRIYAPVHTMEEAHLLEHQRLRSETFRNFLTDIDRWPDDTILATLIDFEILPEDSLTAVPVLIRLPRGQGKEDQIRGDVETLLSSRTLTSANGVILSLSFQDLDSSGRTQSAKKILEKHPELFIVLGPPSTSPHDIPETLRRTIGLGDTVYTTGFGGVILNAENITPFQATESENLESEEELLSSAILDGDTQKAGDTINRMTAILREQKPSVARTGMMNLLLNLQDTVQVVRSYYHKDFRNRYYRLQSAVQNAETIDEAKTLIHAFTDLLVKTIANERSNRQQAISQRVSDYIHTNFQNPNLYVQSIADYMHLSAPYLGRVYRQQTGRSIPHTINAVRIERARTLLSDTDKPIELIAEEVGFTSKTYFHRVFKQVVGTTPGTFRESER